MASTDGTMAVANQQAMGVSPEATQMLNTFWQRASDTIKRMSNNEFKNHELPLARIKKIMKLDEDVKMISAEAPVLFAKAAEIFISELSLRSWIHTEDNKRRTLQRNDIAMAICKYDQFDFLIDIVPREELKPPKRPEETTRSSSIVDQVQLYVQMAQQAAGGVTPQTQATTAIQQATVAQVPQVIQQAVVQPTAAPQTIQLPAAQIVQQQPFQIQTVQPPAVTQQQPVPQQIIQVQSVQPATLPAVTQANPTGTQVFQQVVTPSGEIQNVPIQLTSAQLQALQLQIQGKQSGQQQIVLQSADGDGDTQEATATEQFSQQPVYQLQQLAGQGQQVYLQEGECESLDTQQS